MTPPRDRHLRAVGQKNEPARAMPHDTRIESAILGSLCVSPAAIEEAAQLGVLAKHFYKLPNQYMFSAMVDLHTRGEPVDMVTLEFELTRTNRLEEAGGPHAVQMLFEVIPTAANLAHYAKALFRLYNQRCREISARDALKHLEEGQLERAAELFRLAARPVEETPEPENALVTAFIPDSPYCIWNGCYAERQWTKGEPKQELQPKPLTNFTIEIIAEEYGDDGAGEPERRIRMRGRLASGAPLHEKTVRAEDWQHITGWLHKDWGHKPVMHVPPEIVRKVISLQHQNTPDRKYFTHLGWTKAPDGSPVFILPQGPVTPIAGETFPQGTTVSVHQEFDGYQLPDDSTDAEVAEAYMWVERFLECADKRATVPVMAAMFLAPLQSVIKPQLALWYAGKSGTRKSSMIAAAMAVWGPTWTREFRMSWQSTAFSLLEFGFQGKDIPVIFDNFVPDERGKEQEKLSHIAYCIGDGASRHRLNQGAQLKRSRPVRGLVVCTGEDTPRGEGQSNRFYTVSMYDNTVKNTALREVQEAGWSGKMAPAMRHYLAYLAARIHDPTWLRAVRQRYDKLVAIGRSQGATHMRLPEQSAWVKIGMDLIKSSHPKKTWASASMDQEIDTALARASVERNNMSAETRLSHRFLTAVHYLIQTGVIAAQSNQFGAPHIEPTVFGWRPSETFEMAHNGDALYTRRFPHAKEAVWVEKLKNDSWFVCLEPEKVYFEIKESLKNACPINESMAGVRRALISDGLMAVHEDSDRAAIKLELRGRPRLWTWKINGEKYLELVGHAPETLPEIEPAAVVASEEE